MIKAREYLWELVEDVTGARLTSSYGRVGGVKADHVEEHGEGAQLHGARAHAREVVADPRDLAHDHADVLAAVGDLDAEQLLDRRAVGEVVDEGRDVVEAVRVGNR